MIEIAQKCSPCEGSIAPLSPPQVQALAASLHGWTVVGEAIEKQWKFKNYAQALDWVNRISAIAEDEGHHPDIAFGWGYVTVSLSTHSIGGLSENDFIVAQKIDEVSSILKHVQDDKGEL